MADNALYNLGEIYEVQKNEKEKALEYYKTIVLKYKGSLFSAEARKRVRVLRGEKTFDEQFEDGEN